jgi:putative transposase
MINGIRCRAYPSTKQAEILSRWIGCARVIYNAKVAEMQYFHTFSRKSLGAGPAPDIDQAYSQFKSKELTPYLYEVPSQILRNASTQFMTAWQRYRSGLASRPVFKAKGVRDSVILTSELFQFKLIKEGEYRLILGTQKFPVGNLLFKAPAEFRVPKMLCLRQKAGRWYVSFNFEIDAIPEPISREQLLADFAHLDADQLEAMTWGGDLGVRDNLHGSNGAIYRMSTAEQLKEQKREKRRKNLQCKLARQVPGSNRRRKTRQRIARSHEKQASVKENFSHQVSHSLVNHTDFKVFAFEDLKMVNMVKAPKPKQDELGNYLPNGARAKAGLNKSILGSCWGRIVNYTHYKAARQNKVVIKVAPQFSSQTCSQCGHTSAENRQKKAFRCIQCGFSSDADFNASLVLRQRGVRYVLDQQWQTKKPKKSVAFRKKPEAGHLRLSHVEGQSGQTTSAPAKRGNPTCNL